MLLYLKEITDLILHYIDSPRWSIKHASAYAIAGIVTLSGTNISDDSVNTMWQALEKALAAKTWEGKEKVLQALVLLAKHSSLLSSDHGIADQMGKIVFREARRNNDAYRPHALQCMGSFAELRKDVDMYDEVSEIVTKTIKELLSREDDMDLDTSNGLSSRTIGENTLANAAAALIKAMSTSMSTEDNLDPRMTQTMGLLTRANKSSFASKSLKIAMYENLQVFFKTIQGRNEAMSEALEHTLVKYAELVLSVNDEVEQIRLKAAEAALAMAALVKKGGKGLKSTFTLVLEKMQAQERSITVKEKLAKASDVSRGEA